MSNKSYYQLYNHAYSFSQSKVNSGGVTFSLPQNDYGIYGQHVDAYFNTISGSEGATGSLSVWFVSDKGLTYYTHSLGATAAITGYVQSRFPVTPSSTGLGLIDLRGSPDWVNIVGDGILGPTRGSTGTVAGTNTTQYVNGIKAVFGVLKNQYPNIDWAIAGLPHLPYQMAYAPPIGQSPIWDPSLTNNGNYTSPSWWDPQHPTGSSASPFYDWDNVPTTLQSFYEQIVTAGVQKVVFDNCAVDWICPDIRVPHTDGLPFYEYGYNPNANYKRNRRVCQLSWSKAQSLLVKSNALISPMYPSRRLNRFDDPESIYNVTEYKREGGYYNIDGTSYQGTTANAAEGYYPDITFRHDMIQGAVDGFVNGFVFYDPMPSLIDIACTADIGIGATGYDAQIRARNFFSSLLYGGTYSDGYTPSAIGYTDPCIKTDLLRFGGKNTVAYLNEIRESVNLAGHGTTVHVAKAPSNGWIRGANNPSGDQFTTRSQQSTNTTASDAVYNKQSWGFVNDEPVTSNCNCPNPCKTDPENPFGSGGGNPSTCCCIKFIECDYPEGDGCFDCPPITIIGEPNTDGPCGVFAECADDCVPTSINVDSMIGDYACGNDCVRQVTVSNSCQCITNLEFGTAVSGTGGPGVGCFCASNDCNGPGTGTPSACMASGFTLQLNGGEPTSNFVLIHDVTNYRRSNGNRFIVTRNQNEMTKDWKKVYSPIIRNKSYATFIQSADTILNPLVSVAALRTQSNREPLRHLPNQYFTT